MARNWVECPTCDRHTATVDDFSVPPGPVATRAQCMACRALDKKPRQTMRLADAMQFASRMVAQGCTVYLRDVETRKTTQFLKFSSVPPEAYATEQPDRQVIVCAVK
jgi:hypothetical protein